MEKIPVYFMPGLAAGPKIFENIKLDPGIFEPVFLEWLLPVDKESLENYCRRLAKKITHKDPVLVGVSFGGVIVQELATMVNARKVIIISSVRSSAEFPRRMRFAKAIKLYKIFPTRLMQNVDWFARFNFRNKFINQRMKMYTTFLSVRDKKYLDWAFEKILLWDRKEIDDNVVHIHGEKDEVFPPRYIKDYIHVPGGTHIMIINKYRWMNKNLPALILAE